MEREIGLRLGGDGAEAVTGMIDVLARLEMVLVDREQQGTGVQNAMQLHPVSRTRSNFPHRSTILYSSYQSRGGRERRTLIRVVLGLAVRRVVVCRYSPRSGDHYQACDWTCDA